MEWIKGWQTFPEKDHRVNILGLVGHAVFSYPCLRPEADIDNM